MKKQSNEVSGSFYVKVMDLALYENALKMLFGLMLNEH